MPSLLLVEDDQELLDVIARRFIRRGYQVTAVRHPRQALEAASVRAFDVALLDRSLPEINGLELMARLGMQLAGLRTILLSGHADEASIGEARRRGAFDYLTKPARLKMVEAAVDRACRDRVGEPLAQRETSTTAS